MSEFIPLSVPNIGGNALKYVTETIETEWVSSVGSYVGRFEKELAAYNESTHAVAVVNGTAALHIALLLAGVKPGDEVLIPNVTFVATSNAVRYCFAHPVFMDSEWATLGMDPEKVGLFLKEETVFKEGSCYNKGSGRRIAAIVPMHTLGHPVEMDQLMAYANEYQIPVIEDAAESLGSRYKGVMCGNIGKMGCISFNGNKIMTTGGGGAIVTADQAIAHQAKHLTTTAKTHDINFDHDVVGYNYRLTNMLAALGVAQLEQLPDFIGIKRRNIVQYQDGLEHHPYFTMFQAQQHVESNWWMYPMILSEDSPYSTHDVIDHLSKDKIQARPLWKLMNSLSMNAEAQSFQCNVSEELHRRVVCLPCSTNLTSDQINRVLDSLSKLK